MIHNEVTTSDSRWPFAKPQIFNFLDLQMSPNWVGPNMPMTYNISEDQGNSYSQVKRRVMFGAYFFVGEERVLISRTAFSVADLFSKVGGVFTILKLVLGVFAQFINMDNLVSYLVEYLYFSRDGEG